MPWRKVGLADDELVGFQRVPFSIFFYFLFFFILFPFTYFAIILLYKVYED